MCNNENTGSRQKNPVRNIDSSQKNVNRKDTIMIENQDNVLTCRVTIHFSRKFDFNFPSKREKNKENK